MKIIQIDKKEMKKTILEVDEARRKSEKFFDSFIKLWQRLPEYKHHPMRTLQDFMKRMWWREEIRTFFDLDKNELLPLFVLNKLEDAHYRNYFLDGNYVIIYEKPRWKLIRVQNPMGYLFETTITKEQLREAYDALDCIGNEKFWEGCPQQVTLQVMIMPAISCIRFLFEIEGKTHLDQLIDRLFKSVEKEFVLWGTKAVKFSLRYFSKKQRKLIRKAMKDVKKYRKIIRWKRCPSWKNIRRKDPRWVKQTVFL
jgi:hypothetical protein